MSGRGFVRLGVSGFLADEILAAQAGKARRIRLRHLRPAGRFGKRGWAENTSCAARAAAAPLAA